jgi:pyridoxal phosphate enzyme (YggS family)
MCILKSKKEKAVQDYSYIERNLCQVRELAEKAALRAGVSLPKLIAVTKSATDEEVLALASYGIEAIGENRTNLFNARRELLLPSYPEMEFHLIGHLQTNKVKYIAESATLIHSLDNLRLADEMEKQGEKRGIKIPVLIEVNSGREEAKSGVMPDEIFAFYESLLPYKNISVQGLMTMAPDLECKEDYRPYFRETYKSYEKLKADGAFDTESPTLSMGMSDSFEVAIEEGATAVRVGRRLFLK